MSCSMSLEAYHRAQALGICHRCVCLFINPKYEEVFLVSSTPIVRLLSPPPPPSPPTCCRPVIHLLDMKPRHPIIDLLSLSLSTCMQKDDIFISQHVAARLSLEDTPVPPAAREGYICPCCMNCFTNLHQIAEVSVCESDVHSFIHSFICVCVCRRSTDWWVRHTPVHTTKHYSSISSLLQCLKPLESHVARL